MVWKELELCLALRSLTLKPRHSHESVADWRWLVANRGWKPGVWVVIALSFPALLLALSGGCWSRGPRDVVVYVALDREFSEPLLQDASRKLGLKPLAIYDLESTKTLGLVTRIDSEATAASCDLFWNNEILHTIRLANAGLLRPLGVSDETRSAYPASFQDPQRRWIGFAARARVLIVNTERLPDPASWPRSIQDLITAPPELQRAIAKPTFGTTATHSAVMLSIWGEERFAEFATGLSKAAVIVSGNKQVADGVASGEFAFGLTDTDDAIVAREAGHPVAIVFPDQEPESLGTLFIPNTLAAPKGSPHPDSADLIAELLLSAEFEKRLAEGASAQIPLHQSQRMQTRVLQGNDAAQVRWMEVDWQQAAAAWPKAEKIWLELLRGL